MRKFFGFKNGVKSFGFTLAEILITLGIIGIVAALALPTLYSRIQDRMTVSKVTRAYAIFSNALKLAQEEYGEVQYWREGDEHGQELHDKYFERFANFLNVNMDCGNCGNKYFCSSSLYHSTGGGQKYKNLSGSKTSVMPIDNHCGILMDGTFF